VRSLLLTAKQYHIASNHITEHSLCPSHRESRPDQTRPDQTRPDQTRPDQTRPDHIISDQTRPDQTRPDQTRPDQTRPDQTRPDQTRPDQTRPNRDCSAQHYRYSIRNKYCTAPQQQQYRSVKITETITRELKLCSFPSVSVILSEWCKSCCGTV
jgi:hypothetical protein